MTAERFLSRRVEFTAMFWDGSAAEAGMILEWVAEYDGSATFKETNETSHRQYSEIRIHTMDGFVAAPPGYWIVKDEDNDFYPCKPSAFDKRFDKLG